MCSKCRWVGLLLKIPTANSQAIGIRSIIQQPEAEALISAIPSLKVEESSNWNKRYREKHGADEERGPVRGGPGHQGTDVPGAEAGPVQWGSGRCSTRPGRSCSRSWCWQRTAAMRRWRGVWSEPCSSRRIHRDKVFADSVREHSCCIGKPFRGGRIIWHFSRGSGRLSGPAVQLWWRQRAAPPAWGASTSCSSRWTASPCSARTLTALQLARRIDEIVVAAREEDFLEISRLCRTLWHHQVHQGDPGRREPGPLCAAGGAGDRGRHGAAGGAGRAPAPLVTPELIDTVAEAAARTGAAAPAVAGEGHHQVRPGGRHGGRDTGPVGPAGGADAPDL